LSRLRFALAIGAAALLCASCDLTVQISTTVKPGGGGDLRIAIIMDAELREQLDQVTESGNQGLGEIEALFARLRNDGWTIERTEPARGLVLAATRTFTDSAGFDRTLSELGDSSQGGSLGDLGPKLDFDTSASFLRTSSSFSGSMDLTGADLDPKLRPVLKQLDRFVHFEVRASLPGAVDDVTGGGATEGTQVVWRPRLGSSLAFSARASELRTTSLLVIVMATLVVMGGLLWLALGRRRPSDTDGPPLAIIPDEALAADESKQ
jgi:hypothetical protein